MVVVVINVDAYLFWLSQISLVILRIHEYVLSGCTVLPDSKESNLPSSDPKAPSECKNIRIVLVSCCTLKCVPTSISSVEIPKALGCHLL